MPKNTLIWGFNNNFSSIIHDLDENGAISPRFWILDKRDKLFRKNQYNIWEFKLGTWVSKYQKIVHDYQENIFFDKQCYDYVYQFIYIFIDMHSREDKKYQHVELHSYLNEFNMLYTFFYSIFIKEKIELCIFSNMPHEGPEYIIYSIAKYMNIRTLMFYQSAVPNAYGKSFYLSSIEDFGTFPEMVKIYTPSVYKIKKTTSKDYFYMKKINYFKPSPPPKYVIIKLILKLVYYGIINRKYLSYGIKDRYFNKFIKFKREEEYYSNLLSSVSEVDYSKKYIYFALHLQPELTTATLGGVFCDQMLAIERLSTLVPDDWLIYVKENPKQTEFMRDNGFWERFKMLKNVKLVPRDTNSLELIKNSQFTSTISGTSGFESLCEQKPVLIFGNAWYKEFDGAFKYDSDDPALFEKIVQCRIDLDQLERQVRDLLSRSPDCVIDPLYIPHVTEYDEQKNFACIKSVIQDFIRK